MSVLFKDFTLSRISWGVAIAVANYWLSCENIFPVKLAEPAGGAGGVATVTAGIAAGACM